MATTLSIENRREDNNRPTRALIVDDVEVASGGCHHPNTATTIADTVSIDDKEGLLASTLETTTLTITAMANLQRADHRRARAKEHMARIRAKKKEARDAVAITIAANLRRARAQEHMARIYV
jgi:hypothetical protein